jgi:hypothetical protein
MGKAVAALVILITVLLGSLGFHWIGYSGGHGRVFCILPKDQLSFHDTWLSADSVLAFTLQHPLLEAQIASGQGWCAGR